MSCGEGEAVMISGWSNFYYLIGSAAAGLIGLTGGEAMRRLSNPPMVKLEPQDDSASLAA